MAPKTLPRRRPGIHIAALALATAVFSWPAMAQLPACTEWAEVLDHLADKYSEVPAERGITTNGWVVDLVASKGGKTWTLVVTLPNGRTCMMAAGENWETIPRIHQLGPGA